jgi:hypothetical protein
MLWCFAMLLEYKPIHMFCLHLMSYYHCMLCYEVVLQRCSMYVHAHISYDILTQCYVAIPCYYVALWCKNIINLMFIDIIIFVMSVKLCFTRHNIDLGCCNIIILTSRMRHTTPFLHVLIMFDDNEVLICCINKAILFICRDVVKQCCYVARNRRHVGRCVPTPRLGPASCPASSRTPSVRRVVVRLAASTRIPCVFRPAGVLSPGVSFSSPIQSDRIDRSGWYRAAASAGVGGCRPVPRYGLDRPAPRIVLQRPARRYQIDRPRSQYGIPPTFRSI